MASLERHSSHSSLFDFFENGRNTNQERLGNNLEKNDDKADASIKTGGLLIKEISTSPISKNTPVDVDVMCISTTPRRCSEHDLNDEVEILPESKAESSFSNRSESSPSRESLVSNYSEDFSSCPSTPQNEDNELNMETTGGMEGAKFSENMTENRNRSREGSAEIDSEREDQSREIRNSQSRNNVLNQTPGSQKQTLVIDDQSQKLRNIQTPKSRNDHSRSAVSQQSGENQNLQSLEKQSRQSTRTHSQQSNVEGQSKQSEENSSAVRICDSVEKEIHGFVQKVKVATPVQLLEKDRDTTQKNVIIEKSPVSTNLTSKEKCDMGRGKTVKKQFNTRKPLTRLDSQKNTQVTRNKHAMNMKSVPTFSKIPSSNNNSKAKSKYRNTRGCIRNSSNETSGNDSVSEAVVNVLKISNSAYKYDDLDSYSDQMLMGDSTSGHSFASRYSIESSPYNSARFSSVSKRNYNPKGRLSLPSIDNTIPGQLIRGGTLTVKRNSDSDISSALPHKKKPIKKQVKTKVGKESTVVTQKMGDYKKTRVPVQLKAEAMLRDGQLEVSVTDKEDVPIGTDNLNVKITVVHKFIEPKPRTTNCRQKMKSRRPNLVTNKDIIKQRAMWPPFNTYTNAEASERYYKCFRY